jgi:hypothetical protein
MKRKVYKILAILILFVLVDQSIGYYMSKLFEGNFCQHSGGDVNWYLKNGKSDVVFVGSSRVNTMVDNQSISKGSSNLSKAGKHVYYNLAILYLLKQYQKFPKDKILLNIELEDFLIENEERLLDDVYYLKYYYHTNRYIKDKINSVSIYEPIKFLSKSYLFNGENFKLFTNQLQSICDDNINGYYPLNTTISKQKFSRDSSMNIVNFDQKINQNVFRELFKIQQICQERNVKFYMLLGPTIKKYASNNRVLKRVIQFCSDNKIELLNFAHASNFKSFQYWADEYHLNKKGSEIYTEMIRKRMNSDQLNQNEMITLRNN